MASATAIRDRMKAKMLAAKISAGGGRRRRKSSAILRRSRSGGSEKRNAAWRAGAAGVRRRATRHQKWALAVSVGVSAFRSSDCQCKSPRSNDGNEEGIAIFNREEPSASQWQYCQLKATANVDILFS